VYNLLFEKIEEKNDHRNIHENYTPEEVRAWHMAVRFVAGSKEESHLR